MFVTLMAFLSGFVFLLLGAVGFWLMVVKWKLKKVKPNCTPLADQKVNDCSMHQGDC